MRTRTFLKVLTICTIANVAQADAPTGAITANDLQHHRWILESVNGAPVPKGNDGDMIPELDFGEQMHVSGNTGCNRLSGTAELRDGGFLIPNMAVTRRMCDPARNELEITMMNILGKESDISIDENNNLILTSDNIVLRFRLRDWVG